MTFERTHEYVSNDIKYIIGKELGYGLWTVTKNGKPIGGKYTSLKKAQESIHSLEAKKK